MNAPAATPKKPTVGSLFAGIGGLDLGFERAGFTTRWQVEIDPICRAVLADRFPHAEQFADVRDCAGKLCPVDVIVGGFPCQDVSTFGKRRGLSGSRTGLFFEAVKIIREIQPHRLVLENVPGLLTSCHGEDFQTVVATLAECGYVGYWRVLDARYFGVPTKRRRVFLVAGFGEFPAAAFLLDNGAMERISGKAAAGSPWADAHPTLLAGWENSTSLSIGGSDIIAEEHGRHKMVEWERTLKNHGFRRGMDALNAKESRAAGNAVVPQVAQWIAQHLIADFM